MNKFQTYTILMVALGMLHLNACHQISKGAKLQQADSTGKTTKFLSPPLITDIYTADPSAHLFQGKIYIYPSHDIDAGTPQNDNGDHFDMRDYHILSMDSINGKITDHGIALSTKDVPWASRQLWAPDAAFKNGTYYLYFPAKDKQDVFRIGVATSKSPSGPFKAKPQPIQGSYSIDPAVFTDTDGSNYMYFGGIWGGQLQRWENGKYNPNGSKTDSGKEDEPALTAKVAKMSADMLGFSSSVKDVQILDANGNPLLTKDHNRRFFEAAWMHKYKGKYYFSYSTGDTHYLSYATGDNPYGPFTYRGTIMYPVQGWTTHHSIIEQSGRWFIYYHDTQLSGKTHLRNIKVTELRHNPDGSIDPIRPIVK
jgi:hypothetical protein